MTDNAIQFNEGAGGQYAKFMAAEEVEGHATKVPYHAIDGPKTISEYNITLTLVDTEYSQALPANCKGIEFWSRNGYAFRFAFTTGKVATPTEPYFVVPVNSGYSSPPNLNLSSKTLYFGTDSAGDVIELICWS